MLTGSWPDMAGVNWLRLECGFGSNAKVLGLVADNKHRAITTYVFAMCWSGLQGSNGFVPFHVLPIINARPRDMADLVDAGMVVEEAGGWRMRDWGEYNESGADVSARSEAMSALARRRWSKVEAAKATSVTRRPVDLVEVSLALDGGGAHG